MHMQFSAYNGSWLYKWNTQDVCALPLLKYICLRLYFFPVDFFFFFLRDIYLIDNKLLGVTYLQHQH